jgi:hypothetical protein
MDRLTAGIGLWHTDIQQIMDGFAYGRNPTLREHENRRPDEQYYPSALELQIGMTEIFTKRGKRQVPFTLENFSAEASQKFRDSLRQVQGIQSDRLSELACESAMHRTLDWVRSKEFRGVHSSDAVYDRKTAKIVKCDISSTEPHIIDISVAKYAKLMTLAQAVNATSFVMHPTSVDDFEGNWLGSTENLEHRMKRKKQFREGMQKILTVYKDEGYTFPICIENLEFPKFPSTAEELIEMYLEAVNIAEEEGLQSDAIGVCFDLQHMRHTYKIINEQHNRSGYEKKPKIDLLIPGFSTSHRRFVGTSYHPRWREAIRNDPTDIADLVFKTLSGNIKVIHLAGNNKSRALDMMGFEDETQGRIYYTRHDEPLDPKVLDMRKSIRMMMHHGIVAPIIIEDQTPGDMQEHLESVVALKKYLDEAAQGYRHEAINKK